MTGLKACTTAGYVYSWVRLQLGTAQPQGVGDDRQRTEGHRGAGPDGADQPAGYRIENAGGDGDADRVVDECEEQILPDVRERRAREAARADNAAQVAADQRDARAFHRD